MPGYPAFSHSVALSLCNDAAKVNHNFPLFFGQFPEQGSGQESPKQTHSMRILIFFRLMPMRRM